MSEKTTKENEQTKKITKSYELSMENFVCDEYSICREERQYVVFLYNILRKYSTPESREKTEDQIGKVEEIFDPKGSIENKLNDKNEINWIKSRVKWMMNAQPDIVVIYSIPDNKTNDKKYLLFIECKFLSGESTYTYTENGEKESEKQTKIQWMIADFLCNYLFRNNNCQVEMKLSSGMKKEQSRLVKFVRGRETKVITENGDMRGEIFLKDLIECDNKIYS